MWAAAFWDWQCDDQAPCPLHSHWKDLRAEIEHTLETTTIADLAGNAKQSRRRRARRALARASATC